MAHQTRRAYVLSYNACPSVAVSLRFRVAPHREGAFELLVRIQQVNSEDLFGRHHVTFVFVETSMLIALLPLRERRRSLKPKVVVNARQQVVGVRRQTNRLHPCVRLWQELDQHPADAYRDDRLPREPDRPGLEIHPSAVDRALAEQ